MQHSITTLIPSDVARVIIPNNRQASLFIRLGATLDDGTNRSTLTELVVVDIDCDASGNLSAHFATQSSQVRAASTVPFSLAWSVSSSVSPAVLTAQVVGYSGGTAEGELRFDIFDAWGNDIEEL